MAAPEAQVGKRPLGAAVYATGLATFLLLMLPIIVVAILSFSAAPNMRFPPNQWSFDWYHNVFSRADFMSGLGYSSMIALIATLLMIGSCLPIGYLKMRKGDGAARAVASIALTPVLVPEVVLGLAALNFFVAVGSRFALLNIIIMHCILMMPFVYKIVEAGFANLSPNAEDAARLLGATPGKAFALVVMPQLTKSLFVAFIFGFVTSFQNFTATLFLIKREVTLPIAIFSYIRTESDPSVAAISTMITIVIFAAVYIADRIVNLRDVVK